MDFSVLQLYSRYVVRDKILIDLDVTKRYVTKSLFKGRF
jgi:hypothetical protein